MNLAYNNLFDTLSPSRVDQKSEQKSYYGHLLEQARHMPDKWMPREKSHESQQVFHIYFNPSLSSLAPHIKAFAYELAFYHQLSIMSISQYMSAINKLCETAKRPDKLNANSDFKGLYQKQVENLHNSIKEGVIKGEKKEGAIHTAKAVSAHALRFVNFLGGYSDKNSWSTDYNLSNILPKKLAKYFSLAELQVYRNELRAAQEIKTRFIPYSVLYDIMNFVYALPPSHIKTVIIIAAHTGLRISEIRGLQTDCLTKVSDAEIKMAKGYLEEMERSISIRPDYSESYWLSGHLIFKKKGDAPIEGAPILVGKEVKQAIDELIELTADARSKADSDMLFINMIRRGEYGVRSYTSLRKDRNLLVEQGMPFATFHQFRATFATILYDLKVPIGMIEKYLNHIRSDVTSGYIASEKERGVTLMNRVLDGRIKGGDDESYKQFEKELNSAVSAPEFAGLTFGAQASLFQRLLKEHDIKIDFGDHGHCVMPVSEVCPHGYESVSPCHTSDCKKFKPDPNEKPFFIHLLDTRKGHRHEIEKLAEEHNSLNVNFERFDNDIKSISNIIDLIEKVS